MTDTKKSWLIRILVGGLIGIAALLPLGAVLNGWSASGPPLISGGAPELVSSALAGILGNTAAMAVQIILYFALGAVIGLSTMPFADDGKTLVLRSLAHFAVTAAILTGLILACSWHMDDWFVLISYWTVLVTVYLIIWLGRWVGWYVEVADLRARLGLTPGPTLFHWRESLPYMGFALVVFGLMSWLAFWCLGGMGGSLLLMFFLLPAGGFFSGLSLGKRHGFCPLYPPACGAALYVVVQSIYNIAPDICLIPMVFALAGNIAGWGYRKIRQKRTEAR